jgi:hypothetical protein
MRGRQGMRMPRLSGGAAQMQTQTFGEGWSAMGSPSYSVRLYTTQTNPCQCFFSRHPRRCPNHGHLRRKGGNMKRLTVFALAVSMLGCATARRIPTASGRPEVTIPIQGDAVTASRLMRGDWRLPHSPSKSIPASRGGRKAPAVAPDSRTQSA